MTTHSLSLDFAQPIDLAVLLCGVVIWILNFIMATASPKKRRRLISLGLIAMAVVVVVMIMIQLITQNPITLSGPAQLIILSTVITLMLGYLTRSWIGWGVMTLSFTLSQTLILCNYAQKCAAGVMTQSCNISKTLDGTMPLTGTNAIYQHGYDPYGLMALWGALIVSAAATAFSLLWRKLAQRMAKGEIGIWYVLSALIGLNLALGASGLLLQLTVPVIMRVNFPLSAVLWSAQLMLYLSAVLGIIFSIVLALKHHLKKPALHVS